MYGKIEKDAVLICPDCLNKEEALNRIVKLACDAYKIKNLDEILSMVIERETKLSTGIGLEISVPHCRSNQVENVIISVILIPQGIQYNSIDGKPVKLIFLIISPQKDIQGHIMALSSVSHAISDEEIRQKLLNSKTNDELYDTLVKRT
jgi:fructose PTS system EIIBC or EIIC component